MYILCEVHATHPTHQIMLRSCSCAIRTSLSSWLTLINKQVAVFSCCSGCCTGRYIGCCTCCIGCCVGFAKLAVGESDAVACYIMRMHMSTATVLFAEAVWNSMSCRLQYPKRAGARCWDLAHGWRRGCHLPGAGAGLCEGCHMASQC